MGEAVWRPDWRFGPDCQIPCPSAIPFSMAGPNPPTRAVFTRARNIVIAMIRSSRGQTACAPPATDFEMGDAFTVLASAGD